ncbi:MAG: DUF3313 family protein, partial [Deltaproteobacteria bacterium]|nr:DUF3313 family protein [Deltaproteobacteria bacterium]
MKNLKKKQGIRLNQIKYLLMLISILLWNTAFAADKEDLKKGDITIDGLAVIKSTRFTETQIKKGVVWSEYTKYQITPVEVSFRDNWKRDYNSEQRSLSMHVTDKDMIRIKETMAKIVHEEFDKALQKEGGLTKVDQPDSNTLVFTPRVINLDIYAPEVQNAPVISRTLIRQAGRATLFLEVHDAVSGEILARWIDTREDPDRGYYEWANR